MNGPARLVICCALAIGSATAAVAQMNLRPTPPPAVTAETEPWYLNGEPVMYEGNIYYPAGPEVHFNGDEMVRSGFYRGVPLYIKTTIEPYSVVFVPLAGGLMQPYERLRNGDLAGTTGSSAPSFPVASPSEVLRDGQYAAIRQAAAPPVLRSAIPEFIATPTSSDAMAPVTLGTLSGLEPGARTTVVLIRRRPDSANGIFVEFDNVRWYISGPPAPLGAARLERIGSVHRFPVYATRRGATTIYIPVSSGLDLVAPYSRRNARQ